MRNKIVLLLTGCLMWLMSSCLGGSEENSDYEIPKNCQIISFKLENDSILGLGSTRFTIDQLHGRIFNMDSLAYGTAMEKAICSVEYMDNTYGVAYVQVVQTAVGDTIDWNASDSLDFSQPVEFIVGAYDGVTTKKYKAQVNVHQLVPDSMDWGLYTDRLTEEAIREQKVIQHTYAGAACYFMYTQPAGANSPYRLYYTVVTDMKNWTALSLEGLPAGKALLSQLTAYEGTFYLPSTDGVLYQSVDGQVWTVTEKTPVVQSLLGYVKTGGDRQPSVLAAIVKEGDALSFAAMDKEGIWTIGEAVPEDFPVTGFGQLNYTSMYYEYLMVVAGRSARNTLLNNAWGTMNGKVWALLTDTDTNYFGEREGVMLTAYDDKLWMIGGLDANGKGLKDMYETTDKGVSWSLIDTLVVLPENYTGRGFSSLQVDTDQFISIIGGKTASGNNEQQEIWRGRINRLGFEK
ncbi:hypothetical protein M2101_000785 [Parabacteroides sp. PM5-20]|uniref:DUF6242 domain-containing protein n=1 Tax=unclassified Parabacteroides TaxID=2649774 RepID=UPI001EF284FE|nr:MULTISPECIES: DUF6242 domain-containing protein [unclassified Parabacteroides]MDH6534127.1 hypothetical protein [Parabacteroides sp. PM5-20]